MGWRNNQLCELLDIEYPIIQAPMAGASTPEMAATAANAGILGSHGCTMLSTRKLREECASINAKTNRSINLNFFVHDAPSPNSEKYHEAVHLLRPWFEKLDAGEPPSEETINAISGDAIAFNRDKCDVLLELSPRVVSFHFGLPDLNLIEEIKEAGIIILASATSVKEAIWLEERGVDAIISQGYEAGGHSGWFLERGASNVAGTMALVPRIVDAVSVPVVAAGGIADGRGIAAALMLGAQGVQIGSAFLNTPECASPPAHKRAIAEASGDDTLITNAFSGRFARSISNQFSEEMSSVGTWPDFPIGNTLTGPLRAASAKIESPEAIALWCGQAAGLVQKTNTKALVERLIAETETVLATAPVSD